ncbi:MAG: hypothetical protein R3243_14470 [Arenibacter latericius]|nr:hypothetical protein [Arenibacter latericius]
MIEIKRNTLTIQAAHEYTYSGQHMGDKKLTVTVDSLTPIKFQDLDYVDFRGDRFFLTTEPTEFKSFSSPAYKHTLNFEHQQYELARTLFTDIVPNNPNNEYYNNKTTDVVFVGDVSVLMGRIIANMDRNYPGWSFTIDPSVLLEDKTVALMDQYCSDALKLVNSLFGLDYWIKGKRIRVGGTGDDIGGEFRYGKDRGICELTRTSAGKKQITRAYIKGSTRNIPSDYRVTAQDKYNPRLMIPDVAAQFNYVDSPNIDYNNIKEGVIINEDIFPSLEDGSGLNEIVSVDYINPEDKGFVVYIKDLGFDINDVILPGQKPTVSMTSGYLSGYEFEIHKAEGQKLTLIRNTDIENNPLPNNITAIQAGDRYVLLNVKMDQSYIDKAELRLLEWAQNQFSVEGIDKEHVVYSAKFSEEQIARGIVGVNKTIGAFSWNDIVSYYTIGASDKTIGLGGKTLGAEEVTREYIEKTLGFGDKTLGVDGVKSIDESLIMEGNLIHLVDLKHGVDRKIPVQQLTIQVREGQILPTYDMSISDTLVESRFASLENGQYAINRSLEEKIAIKDIENQRLTKDSVQGNFIETRWAVNGSTTLWPDLNQSLRDPAGWTTTEPSAGTLESKWKITAIISGVTGGLYENWTTPEKFNGLNTGSVEIVNKYVWDSEITYSGTPSQIQIVEKDGISYFTRVDAGIIPKGTLPVDLAYWNQVESNVGSIATGLLLANLAYIENLGVRNLKTADSGQRIEITGDDNNLSFFDNDNNRRVNIDDNILHGQPGMSMNNGIFITSLNDFNSLIEPIGFGAYKYENEVIVNSIKVSPYEIEFKGSQDDADASEGSIFKRTTGKIAYKDNSGVVHDLY